MITTTRILAILALLPTLLPPVHAVAETIPSAASFYVPTLPDLHQDDVHPLRIWAGHLSSDPKQNEAAQTDVTPHIYFVLTKARRSADKERILFWFNGGPGCSSFDGLMMEVGPWRVDGKGGLSFKEGGWEEYTNVVYVDQPVGTGFSYTSTDKYVHELTEGAEQLLVFIRNFYQVFPEFKGMDTYLAGESFAGQYIPYFADAILNSTMNIPLKAVAIGNGWMDGRRQYPAYLQYALKHQLVEEGTPSYNVAKQATDRCMTELDGPLKGQEPVHTGICESVMNIVLQGRDHEEDGRQMCTNVYDVRLDDTKPACGMNWPIDLKAITPYLGRDDVVRALHANAKPQAWTECRGSVGAQLWNRASPSAHTLLPRVLARIPVMLFVGDQDFICNYVGIEEMIGALEWGGVQGLGTVQTQSWSVNGTAAGTWVESRNLTYVKIFNASHMVGYDVPHVAHDMILRFMGVDFSALAGGSANIPSSVGDKIKPVLSLGETTPPKTGAGSQPAPGASPEQDKAMWEAYYNAGSAALVLVLILLAIGVFLWCRTRRRRAARDAGGLSLPLRGADEESIPLSRSVGGPDAMRGDESPQRLGPNGNGHGHRDEFGRRPVAGKGKERLDADEGTIFEVGDSEDEDDARSRSRGG